MRGGRGLTSKLHDAIVKRLKYVNEVEGRPASYKDFGALEVDGKPYILRYNTLRNNISILKRNDIVERYYNSKASFFVMKGFKFGKHKVRDAEVKELSETIRSLHASNRGLHDIHLRFAILDVWKIVTNSGSRYKVIPESKDIMLPPFVLNGMRIQAIIHHTDTVTATVACSNNPISTAVDDVNGVIRLASSLSRFQERLQRILDECGESLPGGYESIPIPDISTWTVTMWHFAVDSPNYREEKSCMTWKDGQGVLLREYGRKKQGKLRKERQEYPKISLAETCTKILDDNESDDEMNGSLGENKDLNLK